jgi:hypothetical protein
MAKVSQESIGIQEINQRRYDILEKLKQRAEKVGYGSLICELKVHQGRISQVEITSIKERMRADYD